MDLNPYKLSEIQLKICNKLMTIMKILMQPQLSNSFHLSNFYNHITININEPYDLMISSGIEEGDYIFIPEEMPSQKTFQVYTMYKHINKKVQPIPAQLPEDCHI